jgi:type IV pilus assembly protein PilM
VLKKGGGSGPIGLDIGGSSVKLLQLTDRDGQPSIQAAARFNLPQGTVDPAEREKALSDGISQALSSHPFSGRTVNSALGCGEFQMKSLRLPKMPSEEMLSAAEFEARERFNAGEGGQIRFIPAGEVRHGNEIKEEVIVFLARDDAVQQRIAMLETLRLCPAAIDLAPCAMARSFVRFLRRAEDASAVNVFVDVGWQGTTIAMTRGSDLCFLKVLDVGGRAFSGAVGQALNLSMQEAGELRIRLMRENCGRRRNESPTDSTAPSEIRARASDAVRPLVERIGRDIQLCLRYFAVTFRGSRPDSLTLVGGEAHEPALVDIVAPSLDIPCLIGHPLRGMGRMDAMTSQDGRTLAPSWAVACGLALRGTKWIGGARMATSTEPAAAAAG